MPINLPLPISNYFTADAANSDKVAQCFTANAIVKDEKQIYTGQAAIKQWKMDATKKYSYTCEPFASEDKDGLTIVTSKLTGNFPGSPIDLRYFFGLEGNKISFLEIKI